MPRPPILTLSDIALTFGGKPLFEDVSLAVHLGERLALVGRNGSGKSTLLKVIGGLVQPDAGTRFLRPGESVSYMEQDPDLAEYSSLRAFAADRLEPREEYKIEMVAEGLNLNLDADPARASGGERRRAALVRLLASEPDLMLLDEPTNHLDIDAIAWLEEYLRATKAVFILISHDRAFLRALTRSILWIDRGDLRWLDKGFEAFEDWRDEVWAQEDLASHKLKRLIRDEARWAVEGISGRRKRNMGRVRRLGELREEKASHIKRQGTAKLAFEAGSKSGRLIVEAEGVGKAFGDRIIVRGLDVKVMRGERLALVGPNGAGKTTILNILIGREKPEEGWIRTGHGINPVVFDQTRSALEGEKSLWETLTEHPDLNVSGRSDQVMVRGKPRHVIGYLKDFLFDEKQARGPVKALSGGEKARLLLARLMARDSNLLILDEPTNDLDVETLDLLQELISNYDGTVILVSHDRDFLDRTATTTLHLPGDGRATAYAGGWSDLAAQGAKLASEIRMKPVGKMYEKRMAPAAAVESAPKVNLVKLKALEEEMENLTDEIAKLEGLLADPDLFTREPAKFEKATAALLARQERLGEVEEEWLEGSG